MLTKSAQVLKVFFQVTSTGLQFSLWAIAGLPENGRSNRLKCIAFNDNNQRRSPCSGSLSPWHGASSGCG